MAGISAACQGIAATTGSRPGRLAWTTAILGTVLLLSALIASCFALDVTEYGVVTRFGHVVRVLDSPGLHLKAPFDTVVRIDKRLLLSRPAQAEFLTADKKNIVVDSLATWRIVDPRRYLEALGTRAAAEARIADIVLGEIGSVMGRYEFASLVSADRSAGQFGSIVAEIREHATSFAGHAYGIALVDLDLRHIFLPEQNKEHVFDRMKAERGKIAKEQRSAGELEAKEIIAKADHEKADIEANAYAEAQRLRAEGDAEATRLYAAAFGRDTRFYKFLRVLTAYRQFMDDKTTLFLPGNAEALGMLRYELKRQSEEPAAPAASRPLAAQTPAGTVP
jgi:membrane protease subunit HflC